MAPDQYRAKDCKSEAYHLYVYLSESSAQFGTVTAPPGGWDLGATYLVRLQMRELCCGWSIPMYISFQIESQLPQATITANPATTVCAGSTVEYTAAATGATSYAWTVSGGTYTVIAPDKISVTWPTATTGTVSVIPKNSCTSATDGPIKSISVSVNANPTVNVTITPNSTICLGNSFTINANPTSGGGAGIGTFSYVWNSGQTTKSFSHTPSSSGTTGYYVEVTENGSNCKVTSSTLNVTVQSTPVGGTITATDAAVCPGSSVSLNNVTLGSGDGTITYRWEASTTNGVSGFSTIPGTGSSNTYTVTQTTWFRRITISTLNGIPCESPSNVFVVYPNDASSAGSLATVTSSRTCLVNDNLWHYFRNSSGDIIAAINSNGQNLGNVTMTVTIETVTHDGTYLSPKHGNGGLGREASCLGIPELSMRRWYTITPTTQPPAGSPSTIRLFFTSGDYSNYSSELISWNTAHSSQYFSCYGYTLFADDLAVSKNESADIPISSTSITGGPNSSTQYQISVPSFSTFRFHTTGGIGEPLPVELISFVGWNEGIVNKLRWVTVSEMNSSKYEIEKSLDNNQWINIGELNAAGNSSQPIMYNFTDDNPVVGHNYYRLKMIDNDGTFTYSSVIDIPISEAVINGFTNIYPNPTNGILNMELQSTDKYNTHIIVYNVNGELIENTPTSLVKGLNKIKFNFSHLAKGVYILQFTDVNGKIHTNKFVKD